MYLSLNFSKLSLAFLLFLNFIISFLKKSMGLSLQFIILLISILNSKSFYQNGYNHQGYNL